MDPENTSGVLHSHCQFIGLNSRYDGIFWFNGEFLDSVSDGVSKASFI